MVVARSVRRKSMVERERKESEKEEARRKQPGLTSLPFYSLPFQERSREAQAGRREDPPQTALLTLNKS